MTAETTSDGRRLADVRTDDLRRSGVILLAVLVALSLFLWMMRPVLLAAVLGVVTGIYLLPAARRLEGRLGRRDASAALVLVAFLVPAAAVVVYSYMELSDAATYLQENQGSVAGQVAEALRRLPFVSREVHETVNGGVEAAAGWVQQVPQQLQEALSGFLVATSVYVFTAFYLLTHDRLVVEYLRESVPPKWSALTEALERNISSVLHGTVLAVLVTQTLKALVVLGLNLTLGVPLPFTLAAVAFVVGLFPIVGTWTVYVPAAVYLVAFEGSPLRAGLMVVLGFVLSTLLLSLWVRPKLGAEKSEVLDFYWMFLGLVAGVYAFGPEGLVLGPLLIGILKAAVDTLRTPESWSPGDGESEPDDAEAEVLAEEELEHAEA